jgi:hypothetical protein
MPILMEFADFPEERAIIGSLLMAYGEMEFALLGSLDEVIGPDMNTTMRILFRVNGESNRLSVADAILRPAFTKVNLDGKWGNVYGAIKYCKKVRNQYSHCHWNLTNGKLYFLDFDQDAQSPQPTVELNYHGIELTLLKKQQDFFEYALEMAYFIFFEYRVRLGRLPSHEHEFPKSIEQPPLYNRSETEPDRS